MEKKYKHTYHLTFNKSIIPKEEKIGYCFERILKYIPTFLENFKYREYVYNREICRGCLTCGRDPDPIEEDCPNETKSSNCQENHLECSRCCDIYKRESEIKYKRNWTFLKVEKSGVQRESGHLCHCSTEGEPNQFWKKCSHNSLSTTIYLKKSPQI